MLARNQLQPPPPRRDADRLGGPGASLIYPRTQRGQVKDPIREGSTVRPAARVYSGTAAEEPSTRGPRRPRVYLRLAGGTSAEVPNARSLVMQDGAGPRWDPRKTHGNLDRHIPLACACVLLRACAWLRGTVGEGDSAPGGDPSRCPSGVQTPRGEIYGRVSRSCAALPRRDLAGMTGTLPAAGGPFGGPSPPRWVPTSGG